MRMEDAQGAPRTTANPAPPQPHFSGFPAAYDPMQVAGLGLFLAMSPFFLNPPLFVTLLSMPRGRRG
jgi:hypothetical protein